MNTRIIQFGGVVTNELILSIINDGAAAYIGHVPADCLHQPYMSMDELRSEMDSGVVFWGCEQDDELVGVMGLQEVKDVVLIRHAYVKTTAQRHGVGARLLEELLLRCGDNSVLIGTWKSAVWAIRFYSRFGFEQVGEDQKNVLLQKYWNIPQRQVEESVVLANQHWRQQLGS